MPALSQSKSEDTVQNLARHIASNLPEDTNHAALLSAVGYIASVIFAEIKDSNTRARVLEHYCATLRAASNMVDNLN